jgi:hypothetical protein
MTGCCYPEEKERLLVSLHKIINLARQKVFKSERRWLARRKKKSSDPSATLIDGGKTNLGPG